MFDFVCKNSDFVCLLSSSFKKDIIEYLALKIPSHIVSIPNPNKYRDLEINIGEKENIILFVGRLDMQSKRPDRIIRVWNHICYEYPEWTLYIVGDGACKQDLELLARGNSQIVFTGFQDPYIYYRRAKIICMTSNYEGLPMVLIEAMQCRVVPVAFNSFASVTDIIDDGRNGILIKPFSIKQYEKALRQLMDNPDLLNRMSKYAQQDIKRYSVENVVDLWEQLFKECVVK